MRCPRLHVSGGILLATFLCTPGGAADARGGDVAVAKVQFGPETGPGGRWHVMAIEVAVRPAPENVSRFVDRVRVGVELGYETAAAGARRFEFYRADATAITVPAGRTVFRFGLPPEVVARDRVNADLRFYVIELAAAGEPTTPGPRQIGPGLASPAALENFRQQVAAEAPANDGVLRPEPTRFFGRVSADPPGPTLLPHL